MAQITIRERVREDLEPDDDGVEFTDCSNQWVVDVPVYRHRRH